MQCSLSCPGGRIARNRARQSALVSVSRRRPIRSAALSHSMIHSPDLNQARRVVDLREGVGQLPRGWRRTSGPPAGRASCVPRPVLPRAPSRVPSGGLPHGPGRPSPSSVPAPFGQHGPHLLELSQRFRLVRPERPRHQRLSGPRAEGALQLVVLLASKQLDQRPELLAGVFAVACPLQLDQGRHQLPSGRSAGCVLASSSRKYR